jgi:hypothetical protein
MSPARHEQPEEWLESAQAAGESVERSAGKSCLAIGSRGTRIPSFDLALSLLL